MKEKKCWSLHTIKENKGNILYTKEEKGRIFHTMKEQTVEYSTLARKRKIIPSHSEGKSRVNRLRQLKNKGLAPSHISEGGSDTYFDSFPQWRQRKGDTFTIWEEKKLTLSHNKRREGVRFVEVWIEEEEWATPLGIFELISSWRLS
jgi:hypothetical protein